MLVSVSACSSSGGQTTNNPSSSSSSSALNSTSTSSKASSSAAVVNGKQTATGTVVSTTFAERASDVGFPGDDYADDTNPLILLVLDEPIQVTVYRGGSDYTDYASVIRLPNDEQFRQFSGKQITIAVDSWGEWPADISAVLYDLVIDFNTDGLELVR